MQDVVIPPPVSPAHRAGGPGTPLHGSQVVLPGVLWAEPRCPPGLSPLDLNLGGKTVRYDTLKVAKRLEAELGDNQSGFIEGDPSDWDFLPPPEGFFTVGIDGGYVHNWVDKKHKFEVIVGKSILSFEEGEEGRAPSLKRFG